MTLEELESQNTKLCVMIADIGSQVSALVSALTPQNTCKYTLFEWLDEWFNTYKKPKLKPHSLAQLEVCIRLHIKPNMEDKPLNAYSGLDVQKALNKIIYSRTKKYTYNIYHGAFKQAHRLDLIQRNVMDTIDSVQHFYMNGKALTQEEQAAFIKSIQYNKLKPLYCFYMLSGCRLSEGVNLKWTDIDFDKKLLTIRGTKTKTSFRSIPLFPALEELLRDLPNLGDKVFNTTANALQCNFKRLKKNLTLSFRIHDLRHTFATRCLEKGISLKMIQKWLGHSRLETTANIYTHVQTKFEYTEVEKMTTFMF